MLRAARYVISLGLGTSSVLAACTFGGLADYDIAQCDPNVARQADDVCERLNARDPSTCKPYQCDAASRRCVQKLRDDDRDGDPAVACGGGDCVDSDAAQSSRAAEICDNKDNDCDTFIDEDALTPGITRPIQVTSTLGNEADPSASRTASGFLATYVLSSAQGTCLPLVPLSRNSTGALATGCSMLTGERSLAPRHPFVTQVGGGFGAAFVVTSACPSGRLGYRFQTTTSLGADLTCDASRPNALPSIGLFPPAATPSPGVIAWYEATPAERDDALNACETAKAAPLKLLRVADLKDAGSIKASLNPNQAVTLSQTSISVYPPAFATAGTDTLLLASPDGSDAAVWLLPRSFMTSGEPPTPVAIPSLAGARSVAISTGLDGTTTRVAVAAEIGCAPKQAIKVALGTLTDSTLSFEKTIDIVSDAQIATYPGVTWIPARGGEWWVTWIDDAPSAQLRRFRADGTAIGGSVRLGRQVVLGAAAFGDAFPAYYGFDQAEANGAFVEIPLVCPN